ncbi:transient receptor potential cation channel, subfamily N, member 1 [Ictalurus punctatus]|uniref:Transient receptor potential cation channel, subfamily N, member 1 n=1 Tax=Ictalurus punctatus TaxID=7998 RepID=A0A979ELT7_ICTPU|nr:transient receptor potential cation channel, subfamily N, member 1 [Ictalurus punctatus]
MSVLLFFALFGLTERKDILTFHSDPIPTLTHLVFGIYLVVTVIVLLNLLIAMMSNTYQRIQSQSDTEWKFGRAILMRDITCKSETPSPFVQFTCLFYIMSLCKHRVERQDLVRKKEETEGLPEIISLCTMAHTAICRFRGRQRTQILPEGAHRECD